MEGPQPEESIRINGLGDYVRACMPAVLATVIGGAIAMGVNIPLRSPDDLFANVASVAIVSIFAAILAGMVWARLKGDTQRRIRVFNIIITLLLVVVVVAAALTEYVGEISNTIRYVIPLAAIVSIASSLLTPVFERWRRSSRFAVSTSVIIVVVLAIGYVLTVNEVGFNEVPRLSLPPPPISD